LLEGEKWSEERESGVREGESGVRGEREGERGGVREDLFLSVTEKFASLPH
jgi:hypothetical protein